MVDSRELFRPFTAPEEFERIVEMDTVSEMWTRCVHDYADCTAIVYAGESHTYAQLEEDVARFRALLLERAGESERIAIYSANSYDAVKALLAVTTLGKTAVMMPAHLDAMTLLGCCLKFGAQALVYADQLAGNTTVTASKLPDLPLIPIEESGSGTAQAVECDAKTPCVMIFTGGTTGKSKCALLSNGAVMQGTVNGCYGTWKVFGQRYMLVLPLTHVFGLIRNLLTVLYTGSSLLICEQNKNMFRDAARFRPTVMVMVPALAEMSLTLSKQFGRNMLGDDLKVIICGAAAVSPYLIQEYDKLGVLCLQGYGLTESANLVSGNPQSVQYPDSIGFPYPNQELRIVDGELWLKGRNMMDGYVGEQEEGVYEDGWFKTGDLVRIEDNRLYITGRRKEIIILSNGENISPAEVEAHFNTLPFIQDSQVFEDIDKNGKHIIALEVFPRATVIDKMGLDDRDGFILSELRRVNESLPSHMRVNRMEIRSSDFERTPSMKIVRYKKCN